MRATSSPVTQIYEKEQHSLLGQRSQRASRSVIYGWVVIESGTVCELAVYF